VTAQGPPGQGGPHRDLGWVDLSVVRDVARQSDDGE
jgi:hypothetical protein